jgi:hypothetical protein
VEEKMIYPTKPQEVQDRKSYQFKMNGMVITLPGASMRWIWENKEGQLVDAALELHLITGLPLPFLESSLEKVTFQVGSVRRL